MRDLLAAAYGRDPIPFQTLNFQRGSQQPLHADSIHFHSVPERFMCGVWIALEDVAAGSGPLVYHPGSHRLPVLTMRGAGVNGARPSPQDYERSFVPRFAERIAASGLPEARAVLKKGWAFVWAANLAHGGSAIDNVGSTRRSLVVHNFFEDCLYYTPMTSDVEGGRLDLRVPPNVRTGRWAWPRREGRPARPAIKRIVAAILRDLANRPHVS
jgi:ectoine hydroxylase-related dioxygenase (phytanoyl-CoA dioxygenase family)